MTNPRTTLFPLVMCNALTLERADAPSRSISGGPV
jgi:hypothetical protein